MVVEGCPNRKVLGGAEGAEVVLVLLPAAALNKLGAGVGVDEVVLLGLLAMKENACFGGGAAESVQERIKHYIRQNYRL